MTTQFNVGDRIRHFKGAEFWIVAQLTFGELTECQDVSLSPQVLAKAASSIPLKTECFVYQSVATKKYWIRPCSEFGEMITRPRFEVVGG